MKKIILIENETIQIMSDFTVVKKSTNEQFLLTNNLSLDNKKTDIISIFRINENNDIEDFTFINYFFCIDMTDLKTILDYTTEYLK
jgi:hypothetical protein